MYIVYVGLSDEAAKQGVDEPRGLRVGDSFRLLPGSAITFGRSRLCEVTIEDERLSRAHALLSFLPGDESKLMLVDLMSRTGTWVDGRSAPVQTIEPGAELVLAKSYRFRVQPAEITS